MTVDTLSLAKEIRAELSSTQAEAIAAAIGRAVIEGAATKADLAQAKIELEAKIDAKIEQLRSTLMMWFSGTNFNPRRDHYRGRQTLGRSCPFTSIS